MPIKDGDTVQVHYTGTLADGTTFDSSRDRDPLEFVVGSRSLIAGFEAAVMGKEVGDSVTVTIDPDQAYGSLDEELIFTVPRDQVPTHIEPQEGMSLQLSGEEGTMDVIIVEVTDEYIVLDANHPLAGKALTFAIEIMAIK